MRPPPPLFVTLPADRVEARCWSALAAVAATVVLIWVLTVDSELGTLAQALLGCAGLAAILPLALDFRPTEHQLRWDGVSWWVHTAGRTEARCQVQIKIDAGGALVLHLHLGAGLGRSRHRWATCRSSGFGGDWHAFRTALYSSRTVGGAPRLQPATRPISPSQEE